jgi:tripartite-type tricarboxylate transporter receptor subunit TctC
MTLARRQFIRLATAIAALPAASRIAIAQAYPVRPVTIVVPYAAGGPTDTVARNVSERMRVSLGQPIILENVTGADGRIGVGRVARAAPDGYTLSVGNVSTHVLNAAIYALEYDLLKDFEPIALLTDSPQLIVARRSLPANDVAGLVAWVKANNGKASAGTAGMGSPPHVGGVFLQNAINARFQFVPYRGGTLAMQDLVAGQIDLITAGTSDALPQIRAGTIKAFAVMAKKRLTAAPDIPTVDEVGLPGLYFSAWFALFAPKGTPREAIARLNTAVAVALADPTTRQRLADIGQEIFPPDRQTPEALATLQRAEIEKWVPIIKAANIRGE